MKTRSEIETENIALRTALIEIAYGCNQPAAVARAVLGPDDGGGRKWQTLVQVRENNNTVPGAVTITARRRWQR
jgi:hypothetical protein